ncbi:hypothetical protein BJF83_20870 [Nocardiopsis sp. CNR-923]|uniref:hypothetical protein n=1 Tax=Nocardiopsis sp. CNR-923 TaxID=1904965 RepID=UPI000962B1D1|nr:hypothetical protein [Nocardiopsis sp. CNR-923]OLT26540.1 hypothetical protein BJF83_20870 [Nocardiopsis sp. CNR-923]
MPDHWDDLASDFSHLHRVRGPLEELPATWFWPMCARTFAYQGVMRARLEAAQERGAPSAPAPAPPARRPGAGARSVSARSERQVMPALDFRADDPLLADHVETSATPRSTEGD